MFIYDLKNDFYNILRGKRILVIVNYDIDAICASKILQTLFRYDHMVYSIVPIMGKKRLRQAYEEHKNDVKYVLLINCGGCLDIVEYLKPQPDVTFFICDAHRPMDVCNIYSDGQIKIFGEPNPEDGIPAFEAIFRDDDEDEQHSDDDNSDKENGENENENRSDRMHEEIMKQREMREWEENRNKIMFDYTQYSYYGRSSAIVLFELAWKLSRDSLELLWWAIVGLTEQFILEKIESSTYVLESDKMQSHVSRLTNKASDQTMQTAIKINYEKDLQLALYRHWSVYESLRNSRYSACNLKLWTLRGEKRVHELLVEMGLPLAQAKQQYSSMDMVLRNEFYQMIEKLADKYHLGNIVYGSFTLQYGYRNRFSAADFVYATIAILESIKKDRTPEHCFLEALDSLSRNNKHILDAGIDEAKLFLCSVFKQVQTALHAHQVRSAGPFVYFILNEENPYFSCPHGLTMLTKFLLDGYVSVAKNKRASEQAMIACCPIDMNTGIYLMIGIPPVSYDTQKNFFGKAFEQAAIKANAMVSLDFFDTSMAQIQQSDLTKFLDGLTVLLT